MLLDRCIGPLIPALLIAEHRGLKLRRLDGLWLVIERTGVACGTSDKCTSVLRHVFGNDFHDFLLIQEFLLRELLLHDKQQGTHIGHGFLPIFAAKPGIALMDELR